VTSLGADCIAKEMRAEHIELLQDLLDRAGISVARSRSPERYIGKPPSPSLAALIAAAPAGSGRATTLEGQLVVTAWSRSPSYGWTFAVGVPPDQLAANARQVVIIAVFLLMPVSPMSVYLFAAGMGFLWLGTVPLTSGLIAQIFGVRYLSTLSGIWPAQNMLQSGAEALPLGDCWRHSAVGGSGLDAGWMPFQGIFAFA